MVAERGTRFEHDTKQNQCNSKSLRVYPLMICLRQLGDLRYLQPQKDLKHRGLNLQS